MSTKSTVFSQNLSQNLAENEIDKLFYSNIPELKEEMLCVDNWIKLKNMNKVIMNEQEIEEYNKSSIKSVISIKDLENHKES